jgi:hypothetical protein
VDGAVDMAGARRRGLQSEGSTETAALQAVEGGTSSPFSSNLTESGGEEVPVR